MKKLLLLVLVVVMTFSFAACGSPSSDIQEPSDVSSGDKAIDTPNNESSASPTEDPSDEPVENVPIINIEGTIAETVLVEDYGVKITAKSINYDEWLGPEIKLLIENNSGKNLTFQCRDVTVNGWMANPMMSIDVVDGKSANDSMTFLTDELEDCGISTIADIEFSLHAFDTDSWEDYFTSDPIQLKTSVADGFEYTYDDSGDVAYEGNGIKVVVKGLSENDSLFGPGIVVYVENTSDRNATVQIRDCSINGFMIDGMFSCDILPGKHAIDSITFFEEDLEENDITTIENVELTFHIFDFNSWDDIADSDVITITF